MTTQALLRPATKMRIYEALAGAGLASAAGALVGSTFPHLDAELEWAGQDNQVYRRPRTPGETWRRLRNTLIGATGGLAIGAIAAPSLSAATRHFISRAEAKASAKEIDRILQPAKKELRRLNNSAANFETFPKHKFTARLGREERLRAELAGKLIATDETHLKSYLKDAQGARATRFFGGAGTAVDSTGKRAPDPATSWKGLVDRHLKSAPGRYGAGGFNRRLDNMAKVAFLQELGAIAEYAEAA